MAKLTHTVIEKGICEDQAQFLALINQFDNAMNSLSILGYRMVENFNSSYYFDDLGNIVVALKQDFTEDPSLDPPTAYQLNRTAAYCGSIETQQDRDDSTAAFDAICDGLSAQGYTHLDLNSFLSAKKMGGSALGYFMLSFKKPEPVPPSGQ